MLLASKICSAVLLASLRLIAGLLPLKVHRKLEEWGQSGQTSVQRRELIDRFLSIFLCFGAGLLLSTCFVHMMPEVKTSFAEAAAVGGWPTLEKYPFAEIVVCLGFFTVYLLEELGERMMKSRKKRSEHQPIEGKTIAVEPSRSQPLLAVDGNVERQNYHSHGENGCNHCPSLSAEEQKSVAAAIRSFLLVAALSFHSIFEGMAIGLQPTLSDVWFLFTAVIVHELAIMFCIGMEMLASKLRVLLYVIYMVELGLITSIGVAIGILVTEYVQDPSAVHLLIIAILQGIAAGTLLYVTFLEVLERERQKPGNGMERLLAIVTGFFVLTLLEAFSRMYAVEKGSVPAEPIRNHSTVHWPDETFALHSSLGPSLP